MPMETPQAISSRVPPSSLYSGKPLRRASASHTAASRPPLAMLCPRICANRSQTSAAVENSLPLRRPDEIPQDVPGGIDGLRSVERRLAGHHLAPTRVVVHAGLDQQDAPVADPTEAGLKGRDQRHANLAQCDVAYLHW